MKLPVSRNRPKTIPINEIFGPTIQGEGPDIGRPVYFVRVHNCPVRCEGCDTAYTWNGTEPGALQSSDDVLDKLYPAVRTGNVGVIVSGGEPLLYHANSELWHVVTSLRSWGTWAAIETSGYAGKLTDKRCKSISTFLALFQTVVWSPKITDALRGNMTDEDVHAFNSIFMRRVQLSGERSAAVKIVVRTPADVERVRKFDDAYGWSFDNVRVYLMPFGQNPDELRASIDSLMPALADTGYTLSPRLHSLLWGKERRK